MGINGSIQSKTYKEELHRMNLMISILIHVMGFLFALIAPTGDLHEAIIVEIVNRVFSSVIIIVCTARLCKEWATLIEVLCW